MLQYDELLEAVPRLTPQWLAGFFDGEGSVGAYCSNDGHWRLMVSLSQKDPKVLALIALKYRTFNGPDLNGKIYRIFSCGMDGKKFLEDIRDFVIVKRTEVEAALKFIDLIANPGRLNRREREIFENGKEERIRLADIMKQAKEQDSDI